MRRVIVNSTPLIVLCNVGKLEMTAARRRLYRIRLSTQSPFPGQGKRQRACPPAQGKICHGRLPAHSVLASRARSAGRSLLRRGSR